jgi:hypothetical protein
VSGATWHLLLLRVVASVRLVALTLQVRSGMHETYVRGHSSLAKHCLAGKVMTGLAMYCITQVAGAWQWQCTILHSVRVAGLQGQAGLVMHCTRMLSTDVWSLELGSVL